MATALSAKSVGSVVKLNINGAATNFIVVHQGKPSSAYDSSCDGTWLLMEDLYISKAWDSSNNDYANSDIGSYLKNTFINLFDSDIKSAIKQVKLPYTNGTGSSGSLASGSSGLSTRVFLLSYTEVGFSGSSSANVEGAVLSYFNSATNSKRIGYLDGTATRWWLRSPYTYNLSSAWSVNTSGSAYNSSVTFSFGVRPALVLPSTLLVSDSGAIVTNSAPTITSTSGSSGVNLGTKSAGFSFSYTVADADGDTLTVTEKLDGVTKKTFTTTGGTYTFETVNSVNYFKVLNGSHAITITVSDGTETVTFTASFTKSVTEASVTLEEPLTVEGDITAAVLAVTGSIPADAEYTVEVTNNANDVSPVWQDVTNEVKLSQNIIFDNTTCTNGAAFNFRVTVKRGSSGTGGYLASVTGAFQ